MTGLLNVFLLSVLQGVAEFLPVSSSGHLVLGKHLLGLESPGVRLEVALHVGTMFSVLAFYRVRIVALIKGVFTGCRESWRMAINIAVSAVPAVIFYLVCHKAVEASFESVRAVGMALIFTGVVLCAVRWFSGKGKDGMVTLPRAVVIGIAQAIAILPGISRSGMTIATARVAGVAPGKAAEFSFLMSLPLIAGAALKDALSSSSPSDIVHAGVPFGHLIMGALIAGIIGYFALTLLVRLLRGHQFWMFGIYCLVAGGLTLAFLR